MICPNCFYQGKPKLLAKGSFTVLIILLILFFPLGILYAILCSTGPNNICRKCQTPLIPEDTPRGRELVSKATTIQ